MVFAGGWGLAVGGWGEEAKGRADRPRSAGSLSHERTGAGRWIIIIGSKEVAQGPETLVVNARISSQADEEC